MRRTFALGPVAFALALAAPAFADDCRLRGFVVDNFGHPLGGVEVGVEDAVVAVTGADGAYDVDCTPGRLALWFRKDAHAPEAVVANLGGPETPPTARIEMTRLPPGPGVWLNDGDAYTHVPPLKLEVLDRTRPDGSTERQYHVPVGAKLPRIQTEGGDVRIVDAEPRPLALVRADGDLVASERYARGDWSTPAGLTLRPVAERGRQVADLSLRRVKPTEDADAVTCLVPTTCLRGRRALATEGATASAWCFVTNEAQASLPATSSAGDVLSIRQTLGELRDAARAIDAFAARQPLAATEGVVPLRDVLVGQKDAPVGDAWGRELVVQVGADGRWAVGSTGVRGVPPGELLESSGEGALVVRPQVSRTRPGVTPSPEPPLPR